MQENQKKVTHSTEQVKSMNIFEKLTFVQAKLQSKKDETNSQLKAKYRKVEKILADLKPLLVEYRLNLRFNESVLALGEMDFKNSVIFTDDKTKNITQTDTIETGNRFYIKSNLILVNIDNITEVINSEGLSREAPFKKGVQVEMLSGMATTYARKKALEGLFLTADNDALDPDSIIEEQDNLEEKRGSQENLYHSFKDEIDNCTAIDESFQALGKRIKSSYLPVIQKEILLNNFIAKGQELKANE